MRPGHDSSLVLAVENLTVRFVIRRSGFRRNLTLIAVNGVSLNIERGETVGLVGESGSGKSTVARAVLRLVDSTSGTVRILGNDMFAASRRDLRRLRRHAQMVFQDPYSSLDPAMTVGDSIAEPLEVHTKLSGPSLVDEVERLLNVVGLHSSDRQRYPHEFSGGQRQRIAIARAISVRPQLLICDEAVSALDVSTQNQVVNLLVELREEFDLSLLFIAHDLGLVRHIADRVAVMYLGRIVEQGPTQRVFSQPAHPYTAALLAAVPVPDPASSRRHARTALTGEMPDPLNPPIGCPFHSRCPSVMPVCRESRPTLVDLPDGGSVACHLHTGTGAVVVPMPRHATGPR